jgi:hypothetical protein
MGRSIYTLDRDWHGRVVSSKPPLRAGVRYGKLVALGPAKKRSHWRFRCDCGREWVAMVGNVRSGATRSCGCLRRALMTTHGGSRSLEYGSWKGMISRCENPRYTGYENYGGRGITVCDRWRGSFAAFLEDIGPRGDVSLSLDRIDANGNYEPGNCRWASGKQQAWNRVKMQRVTVAGVTVPLAEVCAALGIPPVRVRTRMARGWSLERALYQPTASMVRAKKVLSETDAVRALVHKSEHEIREAQAKIDRIRSECQHNVSGDAQCGRCGLRRAS